MNYLSAENIHKNYGPKLLVDGIHFGLAKGDKIAIVGINGCGKSTFLKVLARIEPPDDGEVHYRRGITVRYLSQEADLAPELNVLDTIFESDVALIKTVKEYQSLLNNPDTSPEKLQASMEQMDNLDAWDLEARIQEVLGKLGIYDLEQNVGILSGGQQKRVAMARVLIEAPDLLIMDEPTNHLDLDTIEWLEKFIANQNMTMLMVTHDRYFLDNVVDEIIELSEGKIHRYKGNYEYYLMEKGEREARLKTEIDKAKSLYRKELEWLRRQPKARTTKSKSRIDSANAVGEKSKQKINSDEVKLKSIARRLGGTILELHNVSKSYGDKVLFKNLDYKFRKGDRLGIIGANGSGKTTLLETITGVLQPDTGKIKEGVNTHFGYYRQEGMHFKEGQRILEVVQEVADQIQVDVKKESISARELLNRFLFPFHTHGYMVETLSGGEKRRLNLLRTLIKNPNFLILDEPTNDLDLLTLNVLEDYLASFEGCLIIVSHDRYFMNKLIDHLFVFEEDGTIRDFPGTYGQYREWKAKEVRRIQIEKSNAPKVAAATSQPQREKKKLSFNEKREYETLTTDIESLENRQAELEGLLGSGSTNHEELTNWATELETVKVTLEEKTDRWMELAEWVE